MSDVISQFSNFAQLAVLNWTYTTIPMTGPNARPQQWFIGLSSTAPTSTSGGITEPVGKGYSRKGIIFSPSSGNPGQCVNTALIQFTASGGGWGIMNYGIIWDGLTLGNVWSFGLLASPKDLEDGDTLQFQIGALAVGAI